MQSATRQTHVVNGTSAWYMDGDGSPVAVSPELVEIYCLDMYLTRMGSSKPRV